MSQSGSACEGARGVGTRERERTLGQSRREVVHVLHEPPRALLVLALDLCALLDERLEPPRPAAVRDAGAHERERRQEAVARHVERVLQLGAARQEEGVDRGPARVGVVDGEGRVVLLRGGEVLAVAVRSRTRGGRRVRGRRETQSQLMRLREAAEVGERERRAARGRRGTPRPLPRSSSSRSPGTPAPSCPQGPCTAGQRRPCRPWRQ